MLYADGRMLSEKSYGAETYIVDETLSYSVSVADFPAVPRPEVIRRTFKLVAITPAKGLVYAEQKAEDYSEQAYQHALEWERERWAVLRELFSR